MEEEIIKETVDQNDANNEEHNSDVVTEEQQEQTENLEQTDGVKKNKYWEKTRKLQHKARDLEDYADSLARQNAELQMLLERSFQNNNELSLERAANNLAIAEREYVEALAEGDPEKVARATSNVSIATQRITQIESQLQNERSNDYDNNYDQGSKEVHRAEQEYQERKLRERAQDWFEVNTEVIPNSSDYDQNMARKLEKFVEELDKRFINSGRSNLIGGNEYFEKLDMYMDNLRYSKNRKEKIPTHVTGNINGTSGNYNKNIKVTDEMKRAMLAFNMTEEEYLKDYEKQLKQKRG